MRARSLEKSSSILKSVVLDLNLNARMFLRRGRICLSNASEKILIPLGWAAETVFSLYKSDHLKTWKWEIFQLLFHLYQVSCSPDVVFKPSPFTSSLDLAEMINLRRNWFSFFLSRNYDFSLPAVRPRTGSTTPSPSLPRARSPTRCERLLRVHFVQGDRGLLLWQQVMGESEISKNRPGEQRGSVRGWSPWGIDGHIRWLNSVGHRKSLACRHSVTGPVWYPYLNAQCTALTKYRPKKHVNIFHNKTNMAWKLKNWSMKTEHSQVDIKKGTSCSIKTLWFFLKIVQKLSLICLISASARHKGRKFTTIAKSQWFLRWPLPLMEWCLLNHWDQWFFNGFQSANHW